MIDRTQLSLGILAGGRAQRLGGVDKAWVSYEGRPLVERVVDALGASAQTILVSSNGDPSRYAPLPVRTVPDRVSGHLGPLAGIDALLAVCMTPWLLVVPVDLRCIPGDLAERLGRAADGAGAVIEDADGLQPLVAILRVEPARTAVADALASGEFAAQRLVRRLGLAVLPAADLRLGNLNTPADFVGTTTA